MEQKPRVVEVHRGEKKYIFDPEAITNGQYEAIEKELLAAGIDERMTELLNLMRRDDYKLPAVTPEEADKFMNTSYDPSDQSEEAERARQYLMQNAKRAVEIMKTYADCHILLVNAGARPRLVAIMLVPEGEYYTETTYREVLNKVVPSLSREEVDRILANFLPSRIWSRGGIPNYFRSVPHDQSQEGTKV